MILYYKDGNVLIPMGKAGYSLLISAAPGTGKTQLGECFIQAFLCGETSLFKVEGAEDFAVLRVDTEQPEDIIENSNQRILNYCEGVDASRYISLPLVSSRGPRQRWETIKEKIKDNPKIKLVILDNLSGLCTSVNNELEAMEMNNFINSYTEELGIMFISFGHVAGGDGSPLGFVGKTIDRGGSFSARMILNRRNMVTFVNVTKSRAGKVPDFTFVVDRDGNTQADIYMPFPS
jgi:AAA domain